MKHKHADIIHAWADGAEIEIYIEGDCTWVDCMFPSFKSEMQYRVKEQPKYQDRVKEQPKYQVLCKAGETLWASALVYTDKKDFLDARPECSEIFVCLLTTELIERLKNETN